MEGLFEQANKKSKDNRTRYGCPFWGR